MYFCKSCRNRYEITNDSKKIIQDGGSKKKNKNMIIDNLFEKYLENKKLSQSEIKKIDTNSEHFLKYYEGDGKQKRFYKYVISNSGEQDGGDEESSGDENHEIGAKTAHFICTSCGFSEKIPPRTLIYSKIYNETTVIDNEDYSHLVDDPTLMRTRNYICENKRCKTHKDENLNEAVMFKNQNGQIVYLCTVCNKSWLFQQ